MDIKRSLYRAWNGHELPEEPEESAVDPAQADPDEPPTT
jgi:hypothetical protein